MNRAKPEAGRLFERVRKALAHDLRTPLGTIGNYATILEYHDQAKPEDVRAFAARIHSSVIRTSAMLTQLTDALTLAIRNPSGKGAEPATILRSLLAELGLQGNFPAQRAEPERCTELDPELLRFCWRAFLSVIAHAAPQGVLDLDVSWSEEGDGLSVDLWIGKDQDEPASERIDCDVYILQNFDSPAQDDCFALSLAQNLVAARGGSLDIRGRAGVATGLRLSLPSSP